MKVLLINGSPREKGCTYTALAEVEKTLQKNEVQSYIDTILENLAKIGVTLR